MPGYRLRFVFFSHCVPLSVLCSVVSIFFAPVFVTVAVAFLLPFFFWVYFTNERFARFVRRGSNARGGPFRQVIGGGWSHVLQRESAANASFDNRSGKLDGNWWHSGTTIADVQKHLSKEGMGLSSHPSVLTATLGGWIFSNSHGSGGTLWTPQFSSVCVRDQETGREQTVRPGVFFGAKVDISIQRRYEIMSVEVLPVPNVWTRRIANKLSSEKDAAHFLAAPTYLRLIQIGRRGSLLLTWGPDFSGNATYSPKMLDWFQADVLSMWQPKTTSAWFDFPVLPKKSWESVVRLNAANDFTTLPSIFWTPLVFQYTNFEWFLDVEMTGARLYETCRTLEDLFGTIKGRCELRCSASKLMLDFVVANQSSIHKVSECVRTMFPGRCIFQHKGKYQALSRKS